MTIEEAWAAHDRALTDITDMAYGAKANAKAAVLALCHAVLEDWLTSPDDIPAHFHARIDALGKEQAHD